MTATVAELDFITKKSMIDCVSATKVPTMSRFVLADHLGTLEPGHSTGHK